MSRYASLSEHPPLKEAALRELVEGGSSPFKTTPRSYILFCPEPGCGRQKLYVERTTGACKCFRCGAFSWANWALSKVYKRSPEELDQLLYGVVTVGAIIDAGVLLPNFWGEEEPETALLPSAPQYPPAMLRDSHWVDIMAEGAEAGREYMEKRGVPGVVAEFYGVGFNRAEQRVLIPVIVEDALRGWQGRYIHATEYVGDGRVVRIPKVMTMGKLGKECFMFQDRLRNAPHAVLTEGPFDALKCHMLGGNIASMGKDVSTRQLDIIVRSGVKALYIGLDRDAAKEVGHIVKTLMGVLKLYRLLPPPHRGDLGDCTMEEVWEQAKVAEPLDHVGHALQFDIPMPKYC